MAILVFQYHVISGINGGSEGLKIQKSKEWERYSAIEIGDICYHNDECFLKNTAIGLVLVSVVLCLFCGCANAPTTEEVLNIIENLVRLYQTYEKNIPTLEASVMNIDLGAKDRNLQADIQSEILCLYNNTFVK